MYDSFNKVKDLIEVRFFGASLYSNIDRVIICNIEPLFKGMIEKYNVISYSSGFYKCYIIQIDNVNYYIIKIQPGSVIIDILKILKNKCKNLYMLGLVGSLNDDFKIGDIISPTCVFNTIAFNDRFPIYGCRGTICQVDGLIQEKCFYNFLIRYGVDFVDMESYYISYFSKLYNYEPKIIGFVSDLPLKRQFYICNEIHDINYNIIEQEIKR